MNADFNQYRIRVLGKRLKDLRKQYARIAHDIRATELELTERSEALKKAATTTGLSTFSPT